MDVYVNVVGGVRVHEPALDLGIALAVISSLHDIPVPADACVFGEVGLAGEVRRVEWRPPRDRSRAPGIRALRLAARRAEQAIR